MKKKHVMALVAAVSCCVVSGAIADGIDTTQLWLSVDNGAGQAWTCNIMDMSSPHNGDGSWSSVFNPDTGHWELSGSYTMTDNGVDQWSVSWTDVEVDPDPLVTGNFATTNLTGSTADFQVNVMLPAIVPAPTTMYGSITGTLNDTSGNDGATITNDTSGNPIYQALIDGSPVRSLLDTFSASVTGGLINWPDGSYVSSFGPESSVAVTSSIGIDHFFSLTAGDSVTVTSRFEVVPEPASLALLAIGGLALIRRR